MMPLLHWAITSSGLEMMNIGAQIAGSVRLLLCSERCLAVLPYFASGTLPAFRSPTTTR